MSDTNDKIRIVQETVAGKEITTGELADVTSALTEIVNYFRDELGYVVCRITKR